MRKLVLMLILVSIGFVYAQLSDLDESVSHDEEVNSTTAETIITSDPITIVGLSQTTEDQNKDVDLDYGELIKLGVTPLDEGRRQEAGRSYEMLGMGA